MFLDIGRSREPFAGEHPRADLQEAVFFPEEESADRGLPQLKPRPQKEVRMLQHTLKS